MDHVRIDEGVKRGPRHRKPSPLRRDPETGAVQAIPQDLDPQYVLDLYLQAPTTSTVARTLGLRRSSLTLWLRERCPEDWKNVQIARALIRKEDADEDLSDPERTPDALSLARAREMLKSGQWDLERLDSSNYGPKQEITHIDGDLGDRLRRAAERTVEGEARVIPETDTPKPSYPQAQVDIISTDNPA